MSMVQSTAFDETTTDRTKDDYDDFSAYQNITDD